MVLCCQCSGESSPRGIPDNLPDGSQESEYKDIQDRLKKGTNIFSTKSYLFNSPDLASVFRPLTVLRPGIPMLEILRVFSLHLIFL